jgi:tRNA-2-methylthio-N6-dimethylallyladenosine synthase
MKNLYIKTYGCQMNEYDSDKMVDLLTEAFGVQTVDDIHIADLVILNTCSIREKAEEKIFSELGRIRPLKEKNPNLIIAVAGCVASQNGKEIIQRAQYVDLVFGPQTLHRLPDMIKNIQAKTSKHIVDVSFPEIEKFDSLPAPKADGYTAYVSIMEGCSKYCTFCIVPYTRGEEISRPFDDIIAEVVSLTNQGVKEITLLGQNVNAYRGQRHDGTTADLALLIMYIAEIDTLERIRFTTSHPLEFSDSLIDAYASIPKLANHLHLPVQSGSDKILNKMKRGHTALEYRAKIKKLRAVRPDITISTDIIVGFPGESEDDFNDTLKLVDAVGFDNSYCFVYSKRPGTPAEAMEDDVSLETKKARLAILQKKLKDSANIISNNLLNTLQKILVTGTSKTNSKLLTGRTESNRLVHFAGGEDLIGKIIDVKIDKILKNSLAGSYAQE